jgi:hypothetical protein
LQRKPDSFNLLLLLLLPPPNRLRAAAAFTQQLALQLLLPTAILLFWWWWWWWCCRCCCCRRLLHRLFLLLLLRCDAAALPVCSDEGRQRPALDLLDKAVAHGGSAQQELVGCHCSVRLHEASVQCCASSYDLRLL